VSFLFINVNHDVGYESSESIPISLGYVLATLKAEGWEGIILDDLGDRPLSLKNLDRWIMRLDPLLVGFTAYQSTMDRVRFLCRYIRSRHRRIKIALGGPQVVRMPSEALTELEDVDILVRGEGELVMSGLANALHAGEPLESVEGIACKCRGGIVETELPGELPDDLDRYASPYLGGLLNLEGKDTAILLSSRGCSHVCLFCITPGICGGRVRFHSVERTLEEMEFLTAQGIRRFWFADPNFTEDRARTERLLAEKIERGIETPFWFQTRSDLIDPELLTKLREAGADTVAFGLESGSPGILAATNKRIALDQLGANIEAARELGMDTELFSIFGLPGETVEHATETIDFVRSLGVPIISNSGSQQMQLYFGSVYSKNPSRYGFKPLFSYRPLYYSIGDEYETDTMSPEGFRRVRNRWALANEQMEQDVYYKQRLFEIIDFLLENRDDLGGEAAYYAYGALASSALEEFGLLVRFLEGYAELLGDDDGPLMELISGLSFFRESDEAVGPADRVIFDSRSFIEGIPFTGISGKYWDVLLGKGLLLDSFEEGFIGARADEEVSFEFVFPEDYVQEELRGKKVEVHAQIRKAFKRVSVETLEDARNLDIRNRYDFDDLDLLREQNEILYYLALRAADPVKLVRTPSHFLMLVHKLAKLGRRDDVEKLALLVQGKPTAVAALADTLANAGKFSWAVPYYESVTNGGPSVVTRTARCLLNMKEEARALEVLESVPERPDPEFQQMLLECLMRARPESQRIPSLSHHVLDLRVQAAVEREAVMKAGAGGMGPVVHGAKED
jgi:radical SAM superfamily enzyme YgiQ (UPF0313 family)